MSTHQNLKQQEKKVHKKVENIIISLLKSQKIQEQIDLYIENLLNKKNGRKRVVEIIEESKNSEEILNVNKKQKTTNDNFSTKEDFFNQKIEIPKNISFMMKDDLKQKILSLKTKESNLLKCLVESPNLQLITEKSFRLKVKFFLQEIKKFPCFLMNSFQHKDINNFLLVLKSHQLISEIKTTIGREGGSVIIFLYYIDEIKNIIQNC